MINRLETDSLILAEFWSENYMKLNEKKRYFMIFGSKSKDSIVAIGKSTSKESEYEKLFGVIFDKNFKTCPRFIRKAHQKLHALTWLSN